jgi:quercetin dioxygenase-like cupin family protein
VRRSAVDATYKPTADPAQGRAAGEWHPESHAVRERLKVVGFGFATGEELSEHTAAVLQVLSGDATLTSAPTGTRCLLGCGFTCPRSSRTPSRHGRP